MQLGGIITVCSIQAFLFKYHTKWGFNEYNVIVYTVTQRYKKSIVKCM